MPAAGSRSSPALMVALPTGTPCNWKLPLTSVRTSATPPATSAFVAGRPSSNVHLPEHRRRRLQRDVGVGDGVGHRLDAGADALARAIEGHRHDVHGADGHVGRLPGARGIGVDDADDVLTVLPPRRIGRENARVGHGRDVVGIEHLAASVAVEDHGVGQRDDDVGDLAGRVHDPQHGGPRDRRFARPPKRRRRECRRRRIARSRRRTRRGPARASSGRETG